MKHTHSKDRTPIAFDQAGQGPPLILVMGAFNDRATAAPLAAALAANFSVLRYDRRGRGDSGDAAAYAVEREVEDIEALLRTAGGTASLFGYSSGAALALEAAAQGLPIAKLALYELPPAQSPEHPARLAELLAEGRRGDAVEYFQRRVVGIPEPVVVQFRSAPFRPALEAMAHTLVYDASIIAEGRLSAERLARIEQPTLAIAGGASPPVMRQTAATLCASLPNARSVSIDGATHDIVPSQLAPVLRDFF